MKSKIGELNGRPIVLASNEHDVLDYEIKANINEDNNKISNLLVREGEELMSILEIEEDAPTGIAPDVLVIFTEGTELAGAKSYLRAGLKVGNEVAYIFADDRLVSKSGYAVLPMSTDFKIFSKLQEQEIYSIGIYASLCKVKFIVLNNTPEVLSYISDIIDNNNFLQNVKIDTVYAGIVTFTCDTKREGNEYNVTLVFQENH